MDQKPRLLYVEDESEIASIVNEVLADEYDIDHATTGEEGLRLALGRRYDVMVIDRRLPGMSGVDLLEAVRTARIATPAIMLTALGAVDDKVSGLDAGADDYLVKPFDFAELRARLRALRRGRGAGDRREIGDWVFTPASQALYSPSDGRIALTQAETELLELLTSSPEHVFSRDEIIASVFPGGSAATVDTYVHYIRRKSTPEIIDTVRARGYRAGTPR
ncbi:MULTISPECIES: response regulator transcription factor [unclassified Microbacterium]|uniref:response regulator transcription factor n=1 Tax=unclassified Microbacterium TaxID=2609290 RepID=UPI00214B26BD|nr:MULTISPECIES: response regulator transcription factor [unclassified Microbacterium]MCR2783906.1 response regulator transcription factor [Microbacterium sp. zg.B96]MDL5351302.1 response regulator transcription factor [Microbacterium sp. zg-YB36]WIM15249.1 response regulator transcription factor [Microbacterium sp. zg-B96]